MDCQFVEKKKFYEACVSVYMCVCVIFVSRNHAQVIHHLENGIYTQ